MDHCLLGKRPSRLFFAFHLAFFALFILAGVLQPLRAQTQSQYVYTASADYSKNSQTGALTTLPGSPYPVTSGALAIDGQGRFLFSLDSTNSTISMFQIDSSTGALTQVPHSPFPAVPTINLNQTPSDPVALATEKSGKYLYVAYAKGNVGTNAALTPFEIDAANLTLVFTSQLSFDLASPPFGMLSDPKGLWLYVGLGPNYSTGQYVSETTVYAIDPSSGVLNQNGYAGSGFDWGRCIAIDPQGRFFYDGWGQREGTVDSGAISPVDGTSGATFTLNLGFNIFPNGMVAENSGKFLYVSTDSGLNVYSVDQTTGQLTLAQGPVSTITFSNGEAVADPMGPYVYIYENQKIHGYQADSNTGSLNELNGSPFGTAAAYLTISGTPAQSVSGPVGVLYPSSVNFGNGTIGQPVGAPAVSLVNTGTQTLSIGQISITGTNAADFTQSNTCVATLAPNAHCSISVTFTASVSGNESASLQVSDNAPGSPQSIPLTGIGNVPRPAVELVPGSINFGTTAQGSSTQPQSVTLTNLGTATLNISSIALSGSNPTEFSETSACGATLAVNASCTISVTFAPVNEGSRAASLVITDDAPGSPQSVALTGVASVPVTMSTPPSGSTSATVNPGQTAQYSLQLTPGTGFTGNVALACSGAPVAATCLPSPSSLSVQNGSAISFMVNVTTSGGTSGAIPFYLPNRTPDQRWLTPLVCLAICVALAYFRRRQFALVAIGRTTAAFAFLMVLVTFASSGCGGGMASTTPPPLVTPAGTSTITVTATPTTSGGKQLTPQTIQLTLVVK